MVEPRNSLVQPFFIKCVITSLIHYYRIYYPKAKSITANNYNYERGKTPLNYEVIIAVNIYNKKSSLQGYNLLRIDTILLVGQF